MPVVDAPVAAALASLSRALQQARIPWQLGGSGLLRALGLVDTVRDLDCVFPPAMQDRLQVVLIAGTGVVPRFDSQQEDGFVSGFRGRHPWQGVELDMTAGIALDYGDAVAELPFTRGGWWEVDGVPVPLAPVEQWLLIYRFHNPLRARLLEPFVDPERWRAFLRSLDMPPGFTGFRSQEPAAS